MACEVRPVFSLWTLPETVILHYLLNPSELSFTCEKISNPLHLKLQQIKRTSTKCRERDCRCSYWTSSIHNILPPHPYLHVPLLHSLSVEMISEITLKFTFRLNIPQILVIPLMIMILSIFSILVMFSGYIRIYQSSTKKWVQMSRYLRLFPPLLWILHIGEGPTSFKYFFGSIFF